MDKKSNRDNQTGKTNNKNSRVEFANEIDTTNSNNSKNSGKNSNKNSNRNEEE